MMIIKCNFLLDIEPLDDGTNVSTMNDSMIQSLNQSFLDAIRFNEDFGLKAFHGWNTNAVRDPRKQEMN